MFSRWIVTNITSARRTLHCRKTRIPCGDQLVICGLYSLLPNRAHINIATYSGFSIFTMELYCTPEVNTLQLNTVGNSWNTRTRPTRTVYEH
jgi:hypothetical protein